MINDYMWEVETLRNQKPLTAFLAFLLALGLALAQTLLLDLKAQKVVVKEGKEVLEEALAVAPGAPPPSPWRSGP